MWNAEWDGEFVVGGDGNLRLTPAFRLKEFRTAGGEVRVHRELVSALQLVRDRCGKPLSVKGTEADGLGVVVGSESAAELKAAANALKARGVFEAVDEQADGLRVRLTEPQKLPALGLAEALETAFAVTSGFETTGDKFQQITGNFDKAGLSFGPAQVNFGTGTLVPLFRLFQQKDAKALEQCFTDPDDWDDWLRIMNAPTDQQLAFATSISTGRGGHDVVAPWKGYFQAVGRVPIFRETMVESILKDYGGKAARAIKALEAMQPGMKIDHLRCVCALYDLVVQQGSLDKALGEIKARIGNEKPTNQIDLVRIAVEERGKKAGEEWRNDTVSRRVGILNGVPFTVGDRQRANIHFYLLRNLRVADVDRLVSGDMSGELARVRKVIATDDTLLA